MSKKAKGDKQDSPAVENSISRITVSGYKSIRNEQSIDIKPLTILAGANNSGKSSMMQPLLLLKQTLEATYDPGPLLLNGPNVHFTSVGQLLAQGDKGKQASSFEMGISVTPSATFRVSFKKKGSGGLRIQRMIGVVNLYGKERRLLLQEKMTHQEIMAGLHSFLEDHVGAMKLLEQMDLLSVGVIRDRCFLHIGSDKEGIVSAKDIVEGNILQRPIRKTIHLPGLRGNPERAFPVTAVGPMFPGTFQEYTASIIAQWQAEKRPANLRLLGQYLEKLGLTWTVTAKAINDTQVEIQVGRLPHPAKIGAGDMVNIADVGFGVSQVLPVLVALLVAEPGQLVYIEEPEIHLHPRAQSAMAEILADAAKRGVRVVIETHSQLLLLGVQTLVAQGKLSPDLVKLHWFQRRNDGSTQITSADLDEAGAFGNWPEDFAEVVLKAEGRYLDAAESQQTIN